MMHDACMKLPVQRTGQRHATIKPKSQVNLNVAIGGPMELEVSERKD